MRTQYRQPGHSYDASKAVLWPSIVLSDPVKYGRFMAEVACRKLHALNKIHPARLCPVCRQRSEVAA
jgi:hypothetical protein